MRLTEFEIFILRTGKKKYEWCQERGWHPSKLSAILNGTYELSTMEKEDVAKDFNCQVEEIFPPRFRRVAHA